MTDTKPPKPVIVKAKCATCGRSIQVLAKHADAKDLQCGVCAEASR